MDSECVAPSTVVAALSHQYDCNTGCNPNDNTGGYTEMVITHISSGTKYTFNSGNIQTSAMAILTGKYTIDSFTVYCRCNGMATIMGNTHIYYNAGEVQLNDQIIVTKLSAQFESRGPN